MIAPKISGCPSDPLPSLNTTLYSATSCTGSGRFSDPGSVKSLGMTDTFAQLDLEIVTPNGAVNAYIVRVMAPVPSDDHWQCGVQLESAAAKVTQIYGIDSWQALTLALEFVRIHLESSVKKGCQLRRFGEPADLNTLFPRPFSG